jgi:thioredoxin 1
MATVQITEQNFQDTIQRYDIVVLDFWAGWCAPCRAFGPIYQRVSEQHPEICFGKIDTEAERGLAASFDIASIPTVAVFREQIPVFAQPGAMNASQLESLIQAVIGLDMAAVRAQWAAHQEESNSDSQ